MKPLQFRSHHRFLPWLRRDQTSSPEMARFSTKHGAWPLWIEAGNLHPTHFCLKPSQSQTTEGDFL